MLMRFRNASPSKEVCSEFSDGQKTAARVQDVAGIMKSVGMEIDEGQLDKLFVQEGRKVFREVCPAVAEQITEQLASLSIATDSLKRIWLHQANKNMNELIARKVLGRDPSDIESPTILDTYANTSSAGSIIAFNKFHEDFEPGELGVLSSFGAGYSIGSVVLKRV